MSKAPTHRRRGLRRARALFGTLLEGDFGALDRDAAARGDGLADRRAQPALQLVRGVVAAALAGQELLDVLVDAVLLETRRAVVDVGAQRGVPLGAAFAVEEQVDVGERLFAADLVGRTLAHVVHRPATSSLAPRMKPRSRATSASRSRSWARPRCRRDITVPMGVSMISAISLYAKPSTSAR